jgi:4-hydroxybenzoate polyprenyltransferase
MVALQASIGTLNDLVDAPHDAGHKPGKPIPAGLVPVRAARTMVVAAAGVGLALSVPSGGPAVALGVLVLGIGYAYDLVFKGTAWSWLPFAVGIPLLPVFGWYGVTGTVPGSFLILLPVAVIAGAALAIANSRADMERDAAAGVESVATRLGATPAWRIQAALLAVVVGAAFATLAAGGADTRWLLAAIGAGSIVGAGIVIGRVGDSARLERAWELEAIGCGLLAAAWLAGLGVGA